MHSAASQKTEHQYVSNWLTGHAEESLASHKESEMAERALVCLISLILSWKCLTVVLNLKRATLVASVLG